MVAVDSGFNYSCALTKTGGVKCWGDNEERQLGDGTKTERLRPVDVVGLTAGVIAISAGWDHTCAVTSAGGLKCWGNNEDGKLGDGTRTDRLAPVDVVGLTSGVTAISAGSSHTCAVTLTGVAKCWGRNGDGRLGDRTVRDRLTPVDVTGLDSGATAIAAGTVHTCAVTSAGAAMCWGWNSYGQLGDGTSTSSPTPVEVVGLNRGVAALDAGIFHSCAVTTAGAVKCWGANHLGQLGDGKIYGSSRAPIAVLGLGRGAAAIAVGMFHTCAVASGGGVKCWGANDGGDLGDGTTSNRTRPVDVIGFATAKGTVAIGTEGVQVTPARVAPISLRCAAQVECRGTLTLNASVYGRLVGSRSRSVRVTLGSSSFAIAPGQRKKIRVTLTAEGFKLLLRVTTLPTQASTTPSGTGRNVSATTHTIMLYKP